MASTERRKMLRAVGTNEWYGIDKQGIRLESDRFEGPFEVDIIKDDDGSVYFEPVVSTPEEDPVIIKSPRRGRKKQAVPVEESVPEVPPEDNPDLNF